MPLTVCIFCGKPRIAFQAVLRRIFFFEFHQVMFGGCIALHSGLTVVSQRFFIVRGSAISLFIHEAQITLRGSIVFDSGLGEPF